MRMSTDLSKQLRRTLQLFVPLICLGTYSGLTVAAEGGCTSPNADANSRSLSPVANSPETRPTYDIEWKVIYQPGTTPSSLRITGLQKRNVTSTGTWENSTQQWELHWGNRDKQSVRGLLSKLDDYSTPTADFPRVVSPDGACVFYLNYQNSGSFKTVAVVGDSLTQNTYFEPYDNPDQSDINWYNYFNALYPQGRIGTLLAEDGLSVQIDGWGGRRLNSLADIAGAPMLDQAAFAMLDEFRGQSKFYLVNRARVVALGANEAFYLEPYKRAAMQNPTAANKAAYTAKLKEVTDKFSKFVTEAKKISTCLVLVTPPRVMRPHADLSPDGWTQAESNAFNAASRDISNYYAVVYLANPTQFRLAQFDLESESHAYDPYNLANSWFREDTIHLNDTGATKYAESIRTAVRSCP